MFDFSTVRVDINSKMLSFWWVFDTSFWRNENAVAQTMIEDCFRFALLVAFSITSENSLINFKLSHIFQNQKRNLWKKIQGVLSFHRHLKVAIEKVRLSNFVLDVEICTKSTINQQWWALVSIKKHFKSMSKGAFGYFRASAN